MTETLIAAFSSLIALGALVVSFVAHRHQVARMAALDVREQVIEARERAADRREALAQASMIEVRIIATRSSLHNGWVTPRLEIVNPSNQPITGLIAAYRGEVVAGVSGSVGSGVTRSFPLSPSENGVQPALMLHDVHLLFTDAAGTRWRREGGGGLRQGVPTEGGEWEWRDREDPVITQSRAKDYAYPQQPGYGYGYPGSEPPAPYGSMPNLGFYRRRRLVTRVAALLAAVGLVAVLVVTWVMHR